MTRFLEKSDHWIGRGLVLVAPYATPNAWRALGNVKQLNWESSSSGVSAMEHQTPDMNIVAQHYQAKNVAVNMVLEDVSIKTADILFNGTTSDVAGATVTSEVYSLVAGQEYIPLPHRNIASITSLTGPSGTPTHVLGTDYNYSPEQSIIKVIDGGAITTPGSVEATYTYTDYKTTKVHENGTTRWKLLFTGYNAEEEGTGVVAPTKQLLFHKFVASPDRSLGLISEDFIEYSFSGLALYDEVQQDFGAWTQ